VSDGFSCRPQDHSAPFQQDAAHDSERDPLRSAGSANASGDSAANETHSDGSGADSTRRDDARKRKVRMVVKGGCGGG
jgi:hypothetical protein